MRRDNSKYQRDKILKSNSNTKSLLSASAPLCFCAFVLLVLAAGPAAYAQTDTANRVGKLENRVGKIEKRVTSLEGTRGAAANGQESLKIQPLTVTLVSKTQVVGKAEVGIKLVLEFKNLTSYTINGFSGTLVFKPEGGAIYTRRMSYGHAIGSGATAQIELTISSNQTRQYLKFVKAPAIKVVLINQQLHE